jgi:hypothetical protein
MAPQVVKKRNRVLVGNSDGRFGVRSWLSALDADTYEFLRSDIWAQSIAVLSSASTPSTCSWR